MNDPWVVVSIILVVILLFSLMTLVITSFGWYKTAQLLRKREKRLNKEGFPVSARVTKVMIGKRGEYEVFASWYGVETGKRYVFQEVYWSFKCFLGAQPNIYVGDFITVRVNFQQRPYQLVLK